MDQKEQTITVNSSNDVSNNSTLTRQEVQNAKKAFSRFSLCVVLPFFGANIVGLILGSVMSYLAQSGSLSETLANSITFWLIISAAPLLIFFYPVVYLLTKKMPSHIPEKKPFKASQILMFFLITIAAMVIGSYISSFMAALMTSGQAQNSLVSISGAQEIIPMLYAALIAPILEELIFRKLLLDKLSVYGEKWAIIFGALCFALFHANLYQLIYTFCMGLILGYVYLKSGKIINTIIIHICVNILGTVLTPLVMNSVDLEKISELKELASAGKDVPEALMNSVMPGLAVCIIFFVLYFAMVIAGIILFFVNRKKFHTEKSDILPTSKEGVPVILGNAGMILFIVISALFMIFQLIAPILNSAVSQ